MELKFNKNGDAWVAEFEATDKFNLHMEGLLLGSFSILQRTAGGKYTHVRDIPTYPRFDKVFDYDFNALVYPKFIKIVSEVEPTYAEVVSDGEITEIKSQTKEVEVTANGTTQVAPDAGYSYLTGVTVKTNVPQSGGSGAASGGSNMKYIDIRAMDELDAAQVAMFAYCVAGLTEDNTFVVIPLPVEMVMPIDTNKRFAVSIPWDAYVYMNGAKMQVGPTIDAQFGSKLKYLTEEEFYNLG